MSKTLELRVLGPVKIQQGGKPVPELQAGKTLALLSYLAVMARIHTRPALAGLLWGGMPEAKARGNLSKALSTLRQVMGDHLTITRQTVAFEAEGNFWLDVAEFETGVSENSIERLQAVVELYQGDFLEGFYIRHAPEFENWMLAQQARLKALALQALHTLAAHFAEQGEAGRGRAIAYTNQLLRLEPWREEAHRQMMRLLALNGQRGAALAQYETCQQVLAEELEVEPGAEMVALYEQIRDGEYDIAEKTPPIITLPAHQHVDSPRYDLLEMPDFGLFLGRDNELAQLKQWIIDDACRLCVILGVGGVGKTSLAAKFVSAIQEQARNLNGPDRPFAKIIWRSLLNAPPLIDILRQSILFLSDQQIFDIPASLDEQFRLLTKLLQQQRCLLILDNAESIMQAGQRAGRFRNGYEGYGRLIQRLAQSDHQSCLLLTSRESPQALARLMRDTPLVRSLQLQGLPDKTAQQILVQQGLTSKGTQYDTLVERYAGHPLALKLVAETIEELYFGDVDAFLGEETPIFADIRDVLDQQFARLSPLEQEIIIWLAIEREPVSVQALSDDLLGPVTQREYLEALRALQGRSLLERQNDGFSLQNVIIEYTTERFINQVYKELEQDILDAFNRHVLLKAQAKEYVRESQSRLILQPVAERLVTQYGQTALETKLQAFLNRLRTDLPRGYAGGNILNLLLHLKINLESYDFSRLTVWQAVLRGIHLPEINFTRADLTGAIFTDTFGNIMSVTYSLNGTLVAAGTYNGQIRVWRAEDDRLLLTIEGHIGVVNSVAFSPDGQLLASGSSDQTVRLWDVQTGQNLKTLLGHTDWVYSVAFSSSGRIIASGSADNTVRLWDIETGQSLKTLSGYTNGVKSIVFSPDGQALAGGSADNTVRLWDIETGQSLKTFSAHSNRVMSVAFSPDGQTLASGSEDYTIRLWDIKIGQNLKTFSGHINQVRSVAFSPDGQTLASGSDDQVVRLWDVQTGLCLKTLVGHTNRIYSVAFSPEGHLLASGGEDQVIRLWDIQTGQSLKSLVGHTNRVWSVAFSPDGQTLASGNEDHTVYLWDIQTGQSLKPLVGHTNWVYSVAFSPGGQTLASSSYDHTVRLWDPQTGQCLKTLIGHTNWVYSVTFSPNGQTLLSNSSDQTARLWNTQTGQNLKTLSSNSNEFRSVAFSPDGQTLASGGDDHLIRLWDIQTGQSLKPLVGHTNGVSSVAFSPDGQTLASSSFDHTVRLWDPQTGQRLKTLVGHTNWVYSVTFSPNGQTLVSSSEDHTVRLWNVQTGQCLKTLAAHSMQVWSAAFTPDGQTLASGSGDGTIKLWSVKTGDCLQTLRPDRPYERMNITGVTGITEAQKATLKALGAVELG